MKRNSLITSLAGILLVVAIGAGFFLSGARPKLGLDLQGGISAALRPDPSVPEPEDLGQALDLAVQLIRQRVDSLGVAEPDIARQGGDTIVVQLPGITDAERARQVIGQTAQLTFHPVDHFVVAGTQEYAKTPPCQIPETTENGDPVLDGNGDPVYALNPDRPNAETPVDGVRYVCGEVQDQSAADQQPLDTNPNAPRLQDLVTPSTREASPSVSTGEASPSVSTGEASPSVSTGEASPSASESGNALGSVTSSQSQPASQAPSPGDAASPEGSASPRPAATPTDAATPDASASPSTPDSRAGPPQPLKYAVCAAPTNLDPPQPAVGSSNEGCTYTPATDENADPLQGDDIADASPTVTNSGWVVQLDLDGDGGQAFQRATSQLACLRDQGQAGQLAIVLDDVVRSAPNMNSNVACGEGIGGGSATITVGERDPDLAQKEAQDLALVLDVGALPLTLTEATFSTVSPSLGSASLRNGLLAGLVGLLLVGIYLIYFYRLLGVVAIVGLAVFGVLIMGTITLMGLAGFALTLAGVAGIIVSIGITADSSILFFERMRDEVGLGKTVRTATRRGFESAFRTNLAGNTVTLAAALILYFLAVGPVKGFALTLGLSTILDLVILYTYTRGVVGLMAGSGRLTSKSIRVPDAPVTVDATAGGTA